MTDGNYIYRDAIHLPEDHVLTNEEIEAIKQTRFDRWITAITTPVEDIIPIDPIVETV